MKFDVDRDISFVLKEKKAKTGVWDVWNISQDCIIGEVRWHPAWRRYCFFPEVETVFSDRCMIKIGERIEKLNKNHKQNTIKKKV